MGACADRRGRGSALHGLQDLVPGDVGRQGLVPVGIAREDVFAGTDGRKVGADFITKTVDLDNLNRQLQQLAPPRAVLNDRAASVLLSTFAATQRG